jgi:hypothetical protein
MEENMLILENIAILIQKVNINKILGVERIPYKKNT